MVVTNNQDKAETAFGRLNNGILPCVKNAGALPLLLTGYN